MENLLEPKYGIAGILIFLCLHLIWRVIEFWIKIKDKREEASEASILDLSKEIKELNKNMMKLELRLDSTDRLLADLPKIKMDLIRFFAALKQVTGENWKEIRKFIMEEFPS